MTEHTQAEQPQSGRRKKYFVPLENNPEVMTPLAHKLGLSTELGFHDVFSIDEPEMLAFIPRPALALLLTFPSTTEAYVKSRDEEDKPIPVYNGSGPEEEVVWYRQTIGNACGLYGLLHGLSNGHARDYIKPDSDLAKFLNDAIPLKPDQRAELLEDSNAIASLHADAAATGDTAAPQAEDDVEQHYVAFVKSKNNHLWELDGTRKGPLDRGALQPDEDVLSEKALDLGVRAFLKREEKAGGGEMMFSLTALAPTMD